jgi:hypothetical protein
LPIEPKRKPVDTGCSHYHLFTAQEGQVAFRDEFVACCLRWPAIPAQEQIGLQSNAPTSSDVGDDRSDVRVVGTESHHVLQPVSKSVRAARSLR